ncbi:hypothetical protein [Streptomyces chartreusis]|uniref:hypothetical protein n=1 Tax=Streptomyces chartreusis TaxID=1969 RepID=UPI0033BB3E47
MVTTADPDYWFGLEVIRQAFPNVRIVATATTVERIKAGWERKRPWPLRPCGFRRRPATSPRLSAPQP